VVELRSAAWREELRLLLAARSVRHGKFTLASGRESDFYVDCKQVALTARGHFLVGQLLLARVPDGIVAVGGLTLGADPLASAVSYASALSGRELDAVLVRKEAKGHGTGRFVEHPGLPPGAEVAVLEDVITTGGSSLQAVRRLRDEGFVPRCVLALVDRCEGGSEALRAAGLKVECLFSRHDFFKGEE